jgi:hypothetical protein
MILTPGIDCFTADQVIHGQGLLVGPANVSILA